MPAQVAVLRFPGSNCEAETLRALRQAGLEGRIWQWNEPAAALMDCDAFVLPGGFAHQDRIRAGAVAARMPLLEVLSRRAGQGAPVLGICNGAQILVEAGLVPGAEAGDTRGPEDPVRLALAPNRIEGRDPYYTRWVFLQKGPACSLFTEGLKELLPMPMAHGEGRFTTIDPLLAADFPERVALSYARPDGSAAGAFPWNPNDSRADAAGMGNAAGNVLALMPHPERAQILAQIPEDLPGPWGERRRAAWRRAGVLEGEGPGLFLFRALARALGGRRAGG
jgi:phosphoribosylformylglycinamidine synthase subunit PurQ / glutaminase